MVVLCWVWLGLWFWVSFVGGVYACVVVWLLVMCYGLCFNCLGALG